ncbi:DNA-binding transcriptional regulator YbjK [Nakamurella panacisegetis]|uniref:DNA-binding transcriptional regulator YbjK n=1 Tax=Nakamurella panacisegetis TaxID=1090615 RepID=A0A1H0K4N5_9ACTN|nr:TetR family transcriptional regulator [Nakamurella panacisegetis]SDO50844.1 DNA-binding transcriptional regulator YbjK [Nakamurella panacisegetis]
MPRISVAQRRELLLEAAWRVLVRDGFAAATTRAICAEAGMKQGVFHYCFTNRDELLREVAAGLLAAQVSASMDAVGTDGSMEEAVTRAFGVYWDAVEAEPGLHQVLYEITTAVLRDPRSSEIARFQYRRYLDGVRGTLDQLEQIRQIVWDLDKEVLARQVVTVLDGLTLHYLVDRDSAAAHAALAAFAADFATHARPVS